MSVTDTSHGEKITSKRNLVKPDTIFSYLNLREILPQVEEFSSTWGYVHSTWSCVYLTCEIVILC